MNDRFSRPSFYGRFARTADEAFGSHRGPLIERADSGDRWVVIVCLLAVIAVVVIGCFGGGR